MIRAGVVSVAAGMVALGALTAPAATAEPQDPGAVAYLIGACYDPSQPVDEKPAKVIYGCDSSSVMEDMTWTTWGADGATGTGVDNAIECQPNCAEGTRLANPIVVHAWNPLPPDKPGCPENVQFYSEFTVAYPETAPPWIKPGTKWGDDVEYIYVDGMPAAHFFDQGPFSCTPLSR